MGKSAHEVKTMVWEESKWVEVGVCTYRTLAEADKAAEAATENWKSCRFEVWNVKTEKLVGAWMY